MLKLLIDPNAWTALLALVADGFGIYTPRG